MVDKVHPDVETCPQMFVKEAKQKGAPPGGHFSFLSKNLLLL